MKLKHNKINVFAWRRAIYGLEIKHPSRSRACQAKVEFPERWRDGEASQSLAVSACCPLTNAYQARSSGPIAQFWIHQQEQKFLQMYPPPWQIPLQAPPHKIKPKTPIGSYLVSPYCFICLFLVPHCCSLPCSTEGLFRNPPFRCPALSIKLTGFWGEDTHFLDITHTSHPHLLKGQRSVQWHVWIYKAGQQIHLSP